MNFMKSNVMKYTLNSVSSDTLGSFYKQLVYEQLYSIL